jgi:streptogramin lyase
MMGFMRAGRRCRISLDTMVAVAAVTAMLGAMGCGSTASTDAVQPGISFNGRVMGGQQPISGASIVLYQAGSGGPGVGAANLLNKTVTTDMTGGFNFTGDYMCPSSTTQVYLIATGGNPGLPLGGTNPASVMMAALGDCGNLSASTFVSMNEVTTVAAVWALAQFMSPGGIVGSSATNATGLRNAFEVANNLADFSNGAPGGANLPAGATLETAKLITMANILAACVNSDGGSSCSPLFQAATPSSGSAPTNTLDAALNIALRPGSNVGAVFAAAPATGPFQTGLGQAPNDWTMSLTFLGGGLDVPTALAIDSTGSVWVANYFGGVATKFFPTGQPASTVGFADASLVESYGITVDGLDNAWVANEQSPNFINSGAGSITKFNSSGQVLSQSGGFTQGGIYYPYAIAADSAGRVWVADYGRSGASLLASDGSSLFGPSGISPSNMIFPVGVAVDSANNGWFAAQGTTVQLTPSGGDGAFSCCTYPAGIAIDGSGNTWLPQFNSSSLVELGPSGTTLQQISGIGGIEHPEGVATDGAGNVWVTNYRGSSISEFTGSSSSATSTALSPNSGFGTDVSLDEPFSLAIDASGNVWVTSSLGNTVTEFVGAASPIRTPLLGPPVQP